MSGLERDDDSERDLTTSWMLSYHERLRHRLECAT